MIASAEWELVSAVVPVFNAQPYIRLTLGSVLAQTHRRLEVIVVDDGSTDQTAAIVTDLAARDSRIELIRQQNAGSRRHATKGRRPGRSGLPFWMSTS